MFGLFREPRRKFHCFTADPTVAGSETDLQYNLYNAFLVDFSIVVCDRLSAGTVNDGLMLISKLIGTLVPTEHEVHAVADDGNVVSLTSDAFKAMKMGADHGPDSEDSRDACKHCDGVDVGT